MGLHQIRMRLQAGRALQFHMKLLAHMGLLSGKVPLSHKTAQVDKELLSGMALLFGRRGPQSHKTLQVGRELLSERRVPLFHKRPLVDMELLFGMVLRFHKMPLVDKELQFGRQVPRFHMKLQVDMELLYCGSNRVKVHVNVEVAARICILN